ncbi:ankyrin repeat domain-containing protein [Psychromonas sp. KJ10-10]|uniref:ankyrin repeat domain-containing protein n=1 Tax=Psychromonas sp. KJ10-10 TaxID=3391823 RepID=UPI0039B61888
MKNWNDYKKTYRAESDIFDFARTGDLRGFANLLQKNETLDLNATNQKGYSALMLAVYNGERDFCEALLRCGADVHSRDFIGNTVLMGSAYKGDLDIVKLLLQFGANISDTNQTKMTARD